MVNPPDVGTARSHNTSTNITPLCSLPMRVNLPIRKKGKDGETTTRLAGAQPTNPLVNTSGRKTTKSPVNIADSRDLVPETACGQRADAVKSVNSDNTGVVVGGRTSGGYATAHKGLFNRNNDWLRVIGPEPSRSGDPDMLCNLWVTDQDS